MFRAVDVYELLEGINKMAKNEHLSGAEREGMRRTVSVIVNIALKTTCVHVPKFGMKTLEGKCSECGVSVEKHDVWCRKCGAVLDYSLQRNMSDNAKRLSDAYAVMLDKLNGV